MRLILLGSIVTAGVALVLYLSWLPQPKLGLMWFMPDWLAGWTDANQNDTLRTGVPFVGLGVVIGIWLTKSTYAWFKWVAAWLSLVALVLVAEIGQLYLPNRSFDWLDIAWGATGALAGLSTAAVGKRLKTWLNGN